MHIDIVSLSLRELDAVALATNATISMKRGTKEPGGTRLRVAQSVQHAGTFRRPSKKFMQNPGWDRLLRCSSPFQ